MRDNLKIRDIVILTRFPFDYDEKTGEVTLRRTVSGEKFYAAGKNGIYKLDISESLQSKEQTSVINRIKTVIISLIMIAGGVSIIREYWYFILADVLGGMATLSGIILMADSLLPRKVVTSRRVSSLTGELLIPWITVANISVSSEFTNPNSSSTLGTWSVTTVNGKNVIIPNVENPYQKLDLIRSKYNLKF
ncbi:conjugative plasmid protein (pARN3) [Sulfolobales archaeon HS-7]|nr:conjugative plasmid protein (pARN3) [Sulfolobales archaeon HS-7]